MFNICILNLLGNGDLSSVDKKATIRNRTIGFHTLSQTLNGKGTRTTKRIKTTQVKSQVNSSFSADGHKAILNKMNKSQRLVQLVNRRKVRCLSFRRVAVQRKTDGDTPSNQRQTEGGRILTIRINHNSSTALERSLINYWGLKPVLRARNDIENNSDNKIFRDVRMGNCSGILVSSKKSVQHW